MIHGFTTAFTMQTIALLLAILAMPGAYAQSDSSTSECSSPPWLCSTKSGGQQEGDSP